MAIAATTVWECRAAGSDLNGGGFDVASGGVDYSCQASPQASGTVTVSGTTCSATTGIFTSAMVGNVISDGVNDRQIKTYTSPTVVTLDATVAWTSASVRVGGAKQSLAKAVAQMVAGNLIWFSGNQTISSQLAITGATTGSLSRVVRGYGSTRGDGVRPTISTSSAIAMVATTGLVALLDVILDGGDVATDGIVCTQPERGTKLHRVAVTRTKGRAFAIGAGYAEDCEAYALHSTATAGFADMSQGALLRRCIARDMACAGFYTNAGFAGSDFVECVAARCSVGFQLDSAIYTHKLISCIAYANTSHGMSWPGANRVQDVRNCIFWGNGGYGLNLPSGGTQAQAYAADVFTARNAFGSNTSGARNNQAASTDDIALTADPFVNGAANDFRLNNVAGGGALLRNRRVTTPAGADWSPVGPLHPWGVPVAGEAA